MSKAALDRLGERLARHGRITEDDAEVFAAVADAYQDALEQVEQYLADLGYAASTRVKTTGVLIEKLRRESCRLSQVQDLAGARIVLGDRRQQDEAVDRIKRTFDPICSKPCKVKDRRVEPSHGYRAVHVIVFIDGIPVEIQVRTELQDVWAQILERLADQWGRGIRYGEQPENPDALVPIGVPGLTRSGLLHALHELGDLIHMQEEFYLRARIGQGDGIRRVSQRREGGLTSEDLRLPEDSSERAVAIYQEAVRREGRHAVLASPAGTVEALQTLIEAVQEVDEAEPQAMEAQVDRVAAETRRILGMFVQAAEETIES